MGRDKSGRTNRTESERSKASKVDGLKRMSVDGPKDESGRSESA